MLFGDGEVLNLTVCLLSVIVNKPIWLEVIAFEIPWDRLH